MSTSETGEGIWILHDTGWACGGVCVDRRGIVIDSCPIFRKMIGRKYMALAEGVIGYVNYKKFPKAKAPVWSFALEGEDGVYYSCGFDKPCRPGTDDAIEEGDEVKFQWEEDDYGNKVNMKRFKVTKVEIGRAHV